MSVSSNNENPEGARPSETGMSTARGEAQPGSAAARQSLPPLFWIMAAVAAAALVVAGVLAFNLGSHSLQGRDPNAALGQLEGKTPDELQAELIDAGALAAKAEGKRGTIVVITSDGYSFFLERNRAERERVRREKRDARLIGLSALFAALCVVAGFLLGRFLA